MLCLAMCAIKELAASQISNDIPVGGDVPRPGPVDPGAKGMTIESALAKTGFDLRPFFNGDEDKDHACPIRVILYRGGTSKSYDPKINAKALRTERVHLQDAIELKDFRTYPIKIDEWTKHLNQMIFLGSSEVGDKIRKLAGLRHEYARWKKSGAGEEPESVGSFEMKEVARLIDEGKGGKIVGLLELRRNALALEGIAPAHPKMKETVDLLKMFTELLHKTN